MSLRMRLTRTKVVFDYQGEGWAVTFELNPTDEGEVLEAKLEKMLAFVRRERQADQPTQEMRLALEPAAPGRLPVARPVGSASGVGTLMQQGLQQARPFTGIAPVQPVPLEASLQQASTNGWELIGDDD